MLQEQGITNWKTFVASSRAFFDAHLGSPMYQLIETMDELYHIAYLKGSFPKTGREEDDLIHMCFLICHRALLSAATCTGNGQPEDAPAITRRAFEAAKTVLALKADPANFQVWKAIEIRKGRWEARAQSVKPKGMVNLQYKGLDAEPLYEKLQDVIGTLSDSTVHFTLEHVLAYKWEQTPRQDGGADTTFGVDRDRIVKDFLLLADQHRLIHDVFDRCLDGKLLGHPEVNQVAKRAMNLFRGLLRREGFIREATTLEGENW